MFIIPKKSAKKYSFSFFAMLFAWQSQTNSAHAFSGEKIMELIFETITRPTINYDNNNGDLLYYHLNRKNAGLGTGPNQKSLFLDKDSFNRAPGLMVGPIFSLGEFGKVHVDAKVLFGILDNDSSSTTRTDAGYGGAFGYTGDITTTTKSKTDILLGVNMSYPLVSFSNDTKPITLSPTAYAGVKRVSYETNTTGKIWNYTAVGENSATARQRPSETVNETVKGHVSVPEVGLGFALGRSKTDGSKQDLTQLHAGFKHEFTANTNSYFLEMTWDIAPK
ncbi:MAG: hypothetical protein HQM03_04970 [Magnetococcales bacterium]|nr:hypothetical protein [Magnetococcales bacterium]